MLFGVFHFVQKTNFAVSLLRFMSLYSAQLSLQILVIYMID